MLSSISWLQYFSVLAILVTGYYSVIIFIYHRFEIISFFDTKKRETTFPDSNSIQTNILGEAKGNPNESSLSADELRFGAGDVNMFNDDNF
ncbi:MAG: hypothetical protein EOO46_10730 [Flavobacterium sp.]|nr:MAG: hypothetical protein EOO46_10730 [Flavobacterium sp.]